MRVAIYSRVSTAGQKEEGFSLQDQERRLRMFCQQKGYEVIDHYSDDKSGKSFQRPEFQRFLKEIKPKKIQGLVCVRYDRFSRDAQKTFTMIYELKQLGVELLFTEQQLDMSIPENGMVHAMYAMLPQIENQRRGLNTKKGQRQAMREGRWPYPAPYGYKNEAYTKRIVPTDNASFVKRAFDLVGNKGVGPLQAYKSLKLEGMKCSKQGFLNILRKEFYIGHIRIEADFGEPEELIIAQHEPIISPDLFNRIQLRFRPKQRSRKSGLRNASQFPLRGRLKCGECGKNLTGSSSKGRSKHYDYYHCQGDCKERFAAGTANSQLEVILEQLNFHKAIVEVYRDVLWDVIQTKEAERGEGLNQSADRLNGLKNRLEHLDEQFLSGSLANEDYSRMIAKVKQNISEAEQQSRQFEADKAVRKEQIFFGVSLLDDLSGKYKRADTDLKQRMIGSIFSEKLCFDGKKYRTVPLNPAIELMVSNIKPFKKAQKKQASKKRDLSRMAPPLGLEPRTL